MNISNKLYRWIVAYIFPEYARRISKLFLLSIFIVYFVNFKTFNFRRYALKPSCVDIQEHVAAINTR